MGDLDELYEHLEQFTVGEPRDIVKSCLMPPTGSGYTQARALLHRRYGDERRMTAALIEELLAWPTIRSDDAKGLDTFAILLTRCSSMSGEPASEMNQPSVIRGVLQKLPTQLQDRLRREVVVLDDIVRFVDNEARIALDPLYGKLSTTQSHKNMPSETAVKKQLGHSCLATGVTEGQCKTYKCWCCEGEHLLDDCSLFQEKSTMEKRQFMIYNRLCFVCLRQGHRVAGCT